MEDVNFSAGLADQQLTPEMVTEVLEFAQEMKKTAPKDGEEKKDE